MGPGTRCLGVAALICALGATPALANPAVTQITPSGAVLAASQVRISAQANPETACVVLRVRRSQEFSDLLRLDMTPEGGGLFARDITLAEEGDYALSAVATDDPGCSTAFPARTGTSSTTLTIDRTAPGAFDITTPTRDLGGRRTIISAGLATLTLSWGQPADAGGIDHYRVLVNGAERARTDALGTARRSLALTLGGLPAENTIRVVAVDRAGLQSDSGPVRLLVDRSGPRVVWRGPASGWVRATVALRLAFTDPGGSGIARAGVRTRPVSPDQAARAFGDVGHVTAAGQSRILWRTGSSQVREGRHELHAFAVDHAGNLTQATRVYLVDNTAPRFLTPARIMDVSARQPMSRVAVRVRDELSPRLIMSVIIRPTAASSPKAKAIAARNRGNVFVGRPYAVLNRQRSGLATQYVRVPGRLLGPGAYRLTLRVDDLAGNSITRAYTLRVR